MYAKTKKLTALDEAGITDAATIKLDFSLFFCFFFLEYVLNKMWKKYKKTGVWHNSVKEYHNNMGYQHPWNWKNTHIFLR